MAREMFGDVVKPSISVGSKQWYTLPLSILAHVALIAVLIVIPLSGGTDPPDAAGDDGRVRRRAAATAAAATSPAAAAGCGAEAGDGIESVGRSRASALRNQA